MPERVIKFHSMASSSTMPAMPVVSSEVNGEENKSVVNTTTGGSESLLTGVVGARFRPSDEVLAGHYLTKKVSGCTDGPIFPLIKEIDVYQYEPWRLSSLAHDFGEGVMYFFTHVKMKYGKGTNVNRLAGEGFWRKTGNSTDIKGEDGTTIATKTPLAYYKNGQKPMKTQWLMKEFILEKQSDKESKTQLALCVVYFHGRKREQCESDQNVLGDDVLVEIFAKNPVMPSAENPDFPRKSPRSSFGHDEIFSGQIPMSFNIQSQAKASCSNTQSETSTNPSINFGSLTVERIPIGKSDPNFYNTVMEPQGSADPNVYIPSCQSPLPDSRNCLPTKDPVESLEQLNSGSNPSATSEIESLHANNIPFANSEEDFLNPVMESPNSSDYMDQVVKGLLNNQ